MTNPCIKGADDVLDTGMPSQHFVSTSSMAANMSVMTWDKGKTLAHNRVARFKGRIIYETTEIWVGNAYGCV